MNTKVCTKCKKKQTLENFCKDISKKDNLKPSCKECRKAYYKKNKESVAATSKIWYQDNKEKASATRKAWKDANKERVKVTDAAWYEANKEQRKAAIKAWKQANPEKCREYNRRRRARKLEVGENYKVADERYTKELFNHKCFNCDTTENPTIDHHRPLIRGNALTRQNAVLLCQSCNSSKGTKRPTVFYGEDTLSLLDEKLNN